MIKMNVLLGKTIQWYFLMLLLTTFFTLNNVCLADGTEQRREMILWYQPELSPLVEMHDVGVWAANHGFTTIAIYTGPYGINSSQVSDLHSLGLKVWNINIAWHGLTVYNWTQYWLDAVSYCQTTGLDGWVFDDTQNVWWEAQLGGFDPFPYYQNMLDNASIFSSVYGKENVTIEMALGSDSVDFDLMKTANCTEATFSYYYPPDPMHAFANMDASAWNITASYKKYGLQNYYAYQGWLWLEGEWATATLTNESYVNTYNAVVDLATIYEVNDLWVYNFKNLYNNSLFEPYLNPTSLAWRNNQKLDVATLTGVPEYSTWTMVVLLVCASLVVYVLGRKEQREIEQNPKKGREGREYNILLTALITFQNSQSISNSEKIKSHPQNLL